MPLASLHARELQGPLESLLLGRETRIPQRGVEAWACMVGTQTAGGLSQRIFNIFPAGAILLGDTYMLLLHAQNDEGTQKNRDKNRVSTG